MKRNNEESECLFGEVASTGIAIGPVFKLDRKRLAVSQFFIHEAQTEAEVTRLKHAILSAKNDMRALRKKLCRLEGQEQIAILDSHLLMMGDRSILESAMSRIRREKINAEWAYMQSVAEMEASFAQLNDSYFTERRVDIEAISDKVLTHLMGNRSETIVVPKGAIIVAKELTPVDTVEISKARPQAFVTELGGKAGHVAIVARSLGIPCIVGVDEAIQELKDGEEVIVDAEQGRVFIAPSESVKRRYQAALRAHLKQGTLLLKSARRKALSKDKVRLRLAANIEWVEDLSTLKANGAE